MNKKGVILNSVIAGLGLFTIIFMALAYVSMGIVGMSGFNLMSGGVPALILIGSIFTLIAGLVMLGGGVLGLLCDANVIKSETVKKVFRIITLVAVIVAVVANIFVMIGLIIEQMISMIGIGLILNLIISIGALVCGILGFKA